MTTSSISRRFIGIVASLALAFGIGAVGVSPAQAATTVWDRVAACESGGRWTISTGNGYYGGLQFSTSTWQGFGGGRYASTANRASKAEQIAIARRVLAGQGPGAWPVCSRRAGLTRANGRASVNATPATNPGQTFTRAAVAKKVVQRKYSSPRSTKASLASRTVRVKRGDTLTKIAYRYHVAGGWRGLWKLNRKTVNNPNRIYVGQVLTLK